MKGEPNWMRDFRVKSLKQFEKRPMPHWGGDMSEIYFDDIYYYIKPSEAVVDEWEDVPESIKDTYEKLGIPEAERKYLAGVTAQYESEVVYHKIVKILNDKVSFSATWTPLCANTQKSFERTSVKLSLQTTTNSLL